MDTDDGPTESQAETSVTAVSLDPVPATIVAENETRRRDANRRLGLYRCGCTDVDDHVLLGGLEAGGVVGLSSEREDFGITLGIQILVNGLLSRPGPALVITPRPPVELSRSILRGVVAARPSWSSVQTRALLDRVGISQVLDLDGLWEVLADLDRPSSTEIKDSQDDEDDTTPPRQNPHIIMVTHLASLLSSLLTHRPSPTAHAALQSLSYHLRHLTRTLSPNPLILLLNGVSGNNNSTDPGKKPPDQSLRSVVTAQRRNKPAFGNLFAQMLDVHLLCTLFPRTRGDAEDVFAHREGLNPRFVTVVEVLVDEMGVWDETSGRRCREERWGVVDVRDGRVVDAFPAVTS